MLKKFWIILVVVAIVAFVAGFYLSPIINVRINPTITEAAQACYGTVDASEWSSCVTSHRGDYAGFRDCVADALCDWIYYY